MTTPIVALDRVWKRYERTSTHAAVRDASLCCYPGQVVCLLGPSGSGKTTILLLSCGLLTPSAGRVQLLGEDVPTMSPRQLQRLRAHRVGVVFQDFRLLPEITVRENIMLAAMFASSMPESPAKRTERAMEQADIAHAADERPPYLSHGERQRCALARAIVNRPAFIVADEPTASLDTPHARETMAFFRRAADTTGVCVLVATHDNRLFSFASTSFAVDDGVVTAMLPEQIHQTSLPTQHP